MRPVFRDSVLLSGRAVGGTFYRENASEPYVTIPPALIITDSNGATWTLGHAGYIEVFNGRWPDWFWPVLRNDVPTGEHAKKIEYRRGKIRIWTRNGWRVWTEHKPGSMILAPGHFI